MEPRFPKCSFCEADFRIGGPVPFLLPCHHDLCGECLESLGPEQSRQNVPCLICDTSHDTRNLQKDTVRQRDVLDLTARYRRMELVCKHNLKDEEAMCWCLECDKLLCTGCRGKHTKEVPSHRVFNVPLVKEEVTNMTDPAGTPQETPTIPVAGSNSGASATSHIKREAAASQSAKRYRPQAPPDNRPQAPPDYSGIARSERHATEPTASCVVPMDTSEEHQTPGSLVDPPGQAVGEQEYFQDLEKDIKWWKQNHRDVEIKKENVDKILDDLFSSRKLIDKMLNERKEDFLKKRNAELKTECSKQQAEIKKLEKAKVKPRPLVSVHILSAWRSLPIEDLASRISNMLGTKKVDMRFNVVTSPAELNPNSRPLLVLCINNSRLDTDVAHALKDIRGDGSVCVAVFHHKDLQVVKAPKNSEKSLSATGFRSLGAIVDMVFWKNKGVYHCDLNNSAVRKIAGFLTEHARPGF